MSACCQNAGKHRYKCHHKRSALLQGILHRKKAGTERLPQHKCSS